MNQNPFVRAGGQLVLPHGLQTTTALAQNVGAATSRAVGLTVPSASDTSFLPSDAGTSNQGDLTAQDQSAGWFPTWGYYAIGGVALAAIAFMIIRSRQS